MKSNREKIKKNTTALDDSQNKDESINMLPLLRFKKNTPPHSADERCLHFPIFYVIWLGKERQ
jgi:hypothetical protein